MAAQGRNPLRLAGLFGGIEHCVPLEAAALHAEHRTINSVMDHTQTEFCDVLLAESQAADGPEALAVTQKMKQRARDFMLDELSRDPDARSEWAACVASLDADVFYQKAAFEQAAGEIEEAERNKKTGEAGIANSIFGVADGMPIARV